MYILIVAATEKEIEPTIGFLEGTGFQISSNRYEILITGVGLLASMYSLTDKIHQQAPHYIIQAGIAGSFTSDLPPGTVVMVSEETVGDCGVTEQGIFKDLFDLNLADSSAFPYTGKKLVNPNSSDWKKYGFRFVAGVTISEISTAKERIEQLQLKYGAEIESMEGAVLHYVCLQKNIPFLQLRSISNYVGERNKVKWKLSGAIDALNESLIQIIQQPI